MQTRSAVACAPIADARLRLAGEGPILRAVIIDGFHGTVSGDVGKAHASFSADVCAISGTAEGSTNAELGATETAPFEIEASS